MPLTGNLEGRGVVEANLARVNYLVEEPGGGRNRLFINDQNGPLYIVDKKTKQFTKYLDFKGLFRRFSASSGYASGLLSFAFDPDYRRNGRFYTLHLEEIDMQQPREPDSSGTPGLKVAGYQVTEAIKVPGQISREAVLVEWTDTKTGNTIFEGTARELMRIQQINAIHPANEMSFDPAARRGDAEWRVMYLALGDNSTGEGRNMTLRTSPQRLDTFHGKILRIIPDLNERKDSSKISENGRYRIPNDNPFVHRAGARAEVWAYGLRNPHRLSWGQGHLIANVIGLFGWETVVFVRKGANYGYSEREGNQRLSAPNNARGPIPDDDVLPIRIGEEVTTEMVKLSYPVLQYDHSARGGDAIAGGFVYQGKIAALRGKFIFGDLTTGRMWWADFKEMIAAEDGNPMTMAPIHELIFQWVGPDGKEQEYSSLALIASTIYKKRGGKADPLPGRAAVAGNRIDLRLAVDGAGELYLLTKSDGVIRQVTGASER